MKKILFTVIFLFPVFSALATEKTEFSLYAQAEIHAQKKIDFCWKNKEKKEESNSDIQRGMYNSLECMETEIKNLADILFDKIEKEKFMDQLSEYRHSTLDVYATIDQNHKKCHPCGTQTQVLYLADYGSHLDDILKKMMFNVYSYGYKIPPF